MPNQLPEFKNPPVAELVIGVRFKKIEGFSLAHFGLFWSTIRKEFPKSEMAPVYGDMEEIIEPELGLPLPRVWFINEADDHLLQLQKNRFLYNWRKKKGEYPHFSTVKKSFDQYYRKFNEFMVNNILTGPEIEECELTYMNHLDMDLLEKGLFPIISLENLKTSEVTDGKYFSFEMSFNLKNAPGKLFVKNRAVKQIGEEKEFYLLEITARGKPKKLAEQDINEWFECAHAGIVKTFEEITDSDMQKKLWGKNAG